MLASPGYRAFAMICPLWGLILGSYFGGEPIKTVSLFVGVFANLILFGLLFRDVWLARWRDLRLKPWWRQLLGVVGRTDDTFGKK